MSPELQVGDLVDITIRAQIARVTPMNHGGPVLDLTYHGATVSDEIVVRPDYEAVTVKRIAPTEERSIPVEAAAHTLFLFARGGWPASGFKSTLLHAIAQADILNRNRLALAYPEYVAAYNIAQLDDDGIAKLQAIVARDGE